MKSTHFSVWQVAHTTEPTNSPLGRSFSSHSCSCCTPTNANQKRLLTFSASCRTRSRVTPASSPATCKVDPPPPSHPKYRRTGSARLTRQAATSSFSSLSRERPRRRTSASSSSSTALATRSLGRVLRWAANSTLELDLCQPPARLHTAATPDELLASAHIRLSQVIVVSGGDRGIAHRVPCGI